MTTLVDKLVPDKLWRRSLTLRSEAAVGVEGGLPHRHPQHRSAGTETQTPRLGMLAAWAAGQHAVTRTDAIRTAGLVTVGLLGLLAAVGVVFGVVALAPQRQPPWRQRASRPREADEPTP